MTSKNKIVASSSNARKLQDIVNEGGSAIVHVPRFMLGHELASDLHRFASDELSGYVSLVILARIQRGKSITPAHIYDHLMPPARGAARRNSPTEFEQLRGMILTQLRRRNERAVLLIDAIGIKDTSATYRLIQTLHSVLDELYRTDRSRMPSIVIFDDYSLHFHERALGDDQPSTMYLFDPIHCGRLEDADLNRLVKSELSTLPIEQCEVLEALIGQQTGGHAGLVYEALTAVASAHDDETTDELEARVHEALLASETLDGVRRALTEDPVGIARTALELHANEHVIEQLSPRYQTLRQLGVFRWTGSAKVALAGDVIIAALEEFAASHEPRRIGTVDTLSGVRFVDQEDSVVRDEDFVVVHLSDIHVGNDFGYEMKVGGKTINEGSADIAELLRVDLESMGLLGRVDGLVISGDIVCSGKLEEYVRAKEIVQAIMTSIDVETNKVLVIPGNHDIDWKPGEFAKKTGDAHGVSREGYESFLELIGITHKDCFTSLNIRNRAGNRQLSLVGLDSNFVEGPDAQGTGFVSREHLAALKSFFDVAISDYRWIAVHHHVYPVNSEFLDDARRRKVSVMANAPEIISKALDENVEVILHGHQHQPIVHRSQRWLGESDYATLQPVVILGAGSVGAKREALGPVSRNQYFVHVRRPEGLFARSRIMGEEGLRFTAHRDVWIDMPPPPEDQAR